MAAETVGKQMAGFLAKFDPAMARTIKACRAALRKRLPTAIELVYDNYNFFVMGFCSAERSSDCIVSLTANAKSVGLSFYWGATLPDPHGILQGSGTQNRFIRLDEGAKTLARSEVRELIDAAVEQARTPLPKEPGYTVIRSISAKQRPRRLRGKTPAKASAAS
jgi:hypothetical protein